MLSALGRLRRAGHLSAALVAGYLGRLASAPVERHLLAPLVVGTWKRRHSLRLVDALYVELADLLGVRIVTTDAGTATAHPAAGLVGGRA